MPRITSNRLVASNTAANLVSKCLCQALQTETIGTFQLPCWEVPDCTEPVASGVSLPPAVDPMPVRQVGLDLVVASQCDRLCFVLPVCFLFCVPCFCFFPVQLRVYSVLCVCACDRVGVGVAFTMTLSVVSAERDVKRSLGSMTALLGTGRANCCPAEFPPNDLQDLSWPSGKRLSAPHVLVAALLTVMPLGRDAFLKNIDHECVFLLEPSFFVEH